MKHPSRISHPGFEASSWRSVANCATSLPMGDALSDFNKQYSKPQFPEESSTEQLLHIVHHMISALICRSLANFATYQLRLVWKDILLRWDPEDFGQVDHVRVPTDKIWTPDIVLYNYADDRLREFRDAFAVVSYIGDVLWIPQAIFKSSCVIDITHFPFDEQVCRLKFGSWTYDGFKLDLAFFNELEAIDLNDYIVSNEWTVIEHPAKKNTAYYPCCKEPYPDLTFSLRLRRKVAFYNYILILPCVLLSSLTLVLFWLPPESPAKMVLEVLKVIIRFTIHVAGSKPGVAYGYEMFHPFHLIFPSSSSSAVCPR
ncbi:hypothetical protein LSH36_6g07048 [Paralvinella palmiformis]|uniref:Neurotransmitter-gated ion-channel ligand-binding domain-containing protein n=1 Tax=Paralvinella palmiformis TaxID=53620 RepID=A0AAD9NGX3_9ANNE|nr:hypothetical protein LSH36_6g07048 [Paralvinella palmiformis]